MKHLQVSKFLSPVVMMILLSTAVVPVTSCSQTGANVTLDGKSFTVYETEGNAGFAAMSEKLIFNAGTLESDLCYLWGFTKSAYTATKEGKKIKFETTMTSPAEGTMHWTGAVEGEHLDGEMVWHKEGQADIHYSYTTRDVKEASLDGKAFSCPMQMGDSVITEIMTFNNGNLESPSCYEWGFSASKYRAWESGGKTVFQCIYKSPNEGEMLFTGTVEGNILKGNQFWHKAGQADAYMDFTGTMQ